MYELREHVQRRFEPNLEDGLFLIYDAKNDEFRTGGEVVRDIVDGIAEGKSLDEIEQQLVVERDIERRNAEATVREVCDRFESAGFLRRLDPDGRATPNDAR
ncbi:hypothetical protein [Halorussus salinus]|uniref:hypothetical protein n=1 Tax=Halorussus salinus TaxID=1364935 RepID=UPI00109260B2|nr:hypothetical protein [Halorussus salinus]